jgi:hypothetical protein
VSRLTAAAPPGGRGRTSNPGWPRGPPPVGASRRDLPTGCARRSPERSPGDGGSIPPTSTSRGNVPWSQIGSMRTDSTIRCVRRCLVASSPGRTRDRSPGDCCRRPRSTTARVDRLEVPRSFQGGIDPGPGAATEPVRADVNRRRGGSALLGRQTGDETIETLHPPQETAPAGRCGLSSTS